jgi:hypothetical protein
LNDATSNNGSWLGRYVTRFVAAYIVLVAVVVPLERPLNAALAPGIRFGIALLQPNVQVRAVSATESRVTVRLTVNKTGPTLERRQTGLTVATNGNVMLVGPVLALAAALAWRFRTSGEMMIGVAIAAVLALLLSLHEAAMSVCIAVASKVDRSHDVAYHVASFYGYFVDLGGRQLLALASAATGVGVTRLLSRRKETSEGPVGRAHRLRWR